MIHPLRYLAATSVQEALEAAARYPQAAFLAGGTSLLDLMKAGAESPEVVIDLNRLGLDRIRREGDELVVGALVRNSDLAVHPQVVEHLPLLSQALLSGASPQLRHMATVAGNLLQRTRCGYFRDPVFDCNKRRPGSGCSARGGSNRNLAVLGVSPHCIATHPSDMAVALSALEAVVQTRMAGDGGGRLIAIDELYRLPGDTPHRETVLHPGELISEIRIPLDSRLNRWGYRKVRDRASFAFALVAVAVALEVEGETVRRARIALGSVAPKPWRAREAEALLLDAPVNPDRFRQAAAAAVAKAVPAGQNDFKIELVRRLLQRTLSELGGQP
ncbi:MAG: xanthine dehydrogenase family protein subunit M [Candidatus Competibacteraceae bacterium]|nr:xanthine dehydrogenase family protein subunit M [Candidatus Competibacteraceae bacterium]